MYKCGSNKHNGSNRRDTSAFKYPRCATYAAFGPMARLCGVHYASSRDHVRRGPAGLSLAELGQDHQPVVSGGEKARALKTEREKRRGDGSSCLHAYAFPDNLRRQSRQWGCGRRQMHKLIGVCWPCRTKHQPYASAGVV